MKSPVRSCPTQNPKIAIAMFLDQPKHLYANPGTVRLHASHVAFHNP